MANLSTFAEVAALAGDPARAGMLHALMDGRALTASELARVAGVTPQTASGHLARLATAGLLSVEKQGRHRYHRIASPGVAQMMESIMQVAAGLDPKRPPLTVGPKDAALRAARTCYDHLAGRLGVAVAEALAAGGYVGRRRGIGHRGRDRIFRPHRHRTRRHHNRQRQALGPHPVPALPRLERAAPAYRRCDRSRPMCAQLRAGLDTPRRWHACSHDHAEGRARLSSGVQGAVELINQARDASGLPFSTT